MYLVFCLGMLGSCGELICNLIYGLLVRNMVCEKL